MIELFLFSAETRTFYTLTMEKNALNEDVSPIKNGVLSLSC